MGMGMNWYGRSVGAYSGKGIWLHQSHEMTMIFIIKPLQMNSDEDYTSVGVKAGVFEAPKAMFKQQSRMSTANRTVCFTRRCLPIAQNNFETFP